MPHSNATPPQRKLSSRSQSWHKREIRITLDIYTNLPSHNWFRPQVLSQREVGTVPEIKFSQYRGWMTTLTGAAVSTKLLKIKEDVKDPLKT